MARFRERGEVEAQQLTQAIVEAYLFDNRDERTLPPGVKFSSSHSHPPTRTIYTSRFVVEQIYGPNLVCEIGNWVVTRPGSSPSIYTEEVFREKYEPVDKTSERAKCVAELRAASDAKQLEADAARAAKDATWTELTDLAFAYQAAADLLESPKGPKP